MYRAPSRNVPVQNVRYSISITGKMTGKSYAPTEMVIRGLPGWLAWFAGGWGDPIPPGKYWRPASAAAGFDIYTPQGPAWEASRVGQGARVRVDQWGAGWLESLS